MSGKYDDIINLPHHVSAKRPQMSRSARAAQFAPFAALVGLDDEMEETARLTDAKPELEEAEKEKINRVLLEIRNNPQKETAVKLTFFRPDGRKDGGAIITRPCTVRRIDEIERKLILSDRSEIEFDNILSIKISK
ncbi:MAG TPA: YolD-like family protein [Oscillospiraceae bacterium]|nr:YolD-like family protein [Oscillospiraceae bacterium]